MNDGGVRSKSAKRFGSPSFRPGGPELLAAIEQLQVHDHLCLIYESADDQFAAVIPFMKAGLAKGEKCLYIVDNNTADAVLAAMESDGVDTARAQAEGKLAILTKRDAYLLEGYFSPELMIDLLGRAVEQAKSEGFPAVRATGEMTWALGPESGVDRLIEYESKLNYFLPAHDMLAMCQYNRNRFDPGIIKQVIETHPMVIFGGLVCKNHYYVPPDEFLKENQPSLEVQRLLNNILSRERAEIELNKSRKDQESTYVLLQQDIEKRIKVEEDLLKERQLFVSGPVVVFRWRAAEGWPVEYVSPNVIQFGYHPEDLLSGKTPYASIVYPEDLGRVAEEVAGHSAAGAANFEQQYRIVTPDGKTLWLQDYTIIERGKSGGVTHYIGYIFDITSKVEAEEAYKASHERLLTILDGLNAAVYAADMKTYEILFVNKHLRDQQGIGDEVIGRLCWNTLQKGQTGPCTFCTNRKLVNEEGAPGVAVTWEFRNTMTNHWYYVSDRAVKWVDGRLVRLEIATDITAMKEAEERIRKNMAQLEQVNRELEEFNFLASHDIQEPLRGILSFTELLKRDVPSGLDPQARQDLDFVVAASERLKNLVDDLIDLSTAGRAKLKLAPLDLNTVMKKVCADMGSLITQSGARIQWLDLPEVFADPHFLIVMLRNLVDNAIKFRGGQPPLVEVSAERKGGDWVIIVKDNGIGVPEDGRETIFTPFKRFHTRKEYEGTGIGLSICRKIAQRHGGERKCPKLS